MSQYTFNDGDKHVTCGFDRRLHTRHLVIVQNDIPIYSNLSEIRGSLSREQFSARLSEHGVRVPDGLIEELDLDEAGLNAANTARTFELPER